MKFSTRTTYGLRSLARLAEHWGQGSLPLSVIAEKESISPAYLEQIFSRLKRRGLVVAEKGTNGGYALRAAPESITVYEAVEILEGNLSLFRCLKGDGVLRCRAAGSCGASRILVAVQGAVAESLRGLCLKDLIS